MSSNNTEIRKRAWFYVFYFLTIVWSVLLAIVYPIGYFISIFHSGWRPFFKRRGLNSKVLRKIKPLKPRYLFFCSSAGEYEQSIPIMNRLESMGGQVIICFFSPSGAKFARARKETRPYFKSPIDMIWTWKKVFDKIQPRTTFVIRHELWPSLLFVAKYFYGNKTILLNASRNKSHSGYLNNLVKYFLMKTFFQIYVVSSDDLHFFQTTLKIKPRSLILSGDSKYDSVFERASSKKNEAKRLETILGCYKNINSRLILGSAWDKDVDLGLRALSILKKNLLLNLQIAIALHKPTPSAVYKLREKCAQHNLSSKLLSLISLEHQKCKTTNFIPDVIIVDSMGILSELYSCAHAAFIGGAMHYQVHNVLEPACYNLALAFGPLYKNSGEAIKLVQSRCAAIVNSPEDLADWWKTQIEKNYHDGLKTGQLMSAQCGATDVIMSNLTTEQILYDREATSY